MVQKNLLYFQNDYPSLFQRLKNHKSQLHLETTKNNSFTTTKLEGKYIYSKYDPIKEAEKKIKTVRFKHQKNLFFLGYGFGYVLLSLLPISNKKIWIFEQDFNLFYESLKYIDYKKLCSHNRVYFNIEQLSALPDTEDLKNSIFFENQILTNLHKSFYDQVQQKLKEIVETTITDITTMGYFSSIWFRNSILNLKKINHSYSLMSLQNKFKNFSACLVAGGPTLEKTIPLLKKNQHSTLIISVGTSVKRLLSENIVPHFIFSVDGGFYNSWHTRNLKTDSILVTDFSTHFLSSLKYRGKLGFINYDLGYIDFFVHSENDIPKIPMQSTVSASAVEFIHFLGIKNIFIFGQDFGFPEYKTHCKKTIYEEYGLKMQTKMNPYDTQDFMNIMNEQLEICYDYNKRPVLTSLKLKMYQQNFAQHKNSIYQTSKEAVFIDTIPFQDTISSNTNSVIDIINQNLKKIHIPIEQNKIQNKLKEYVNLLTQYPLQEFFQKIDKPFYKGLFSYLEFDFMNHKNNEKKIKQKIKKYIFFIEKKLKKIDKI